jgi:hypothetical protein
MPAANQPNIGPANEARRRIGDDKAAQRLRDRGWLVLEPRLATPRTPRSLEDRLRPAITETTGWLMATLGAERAGRDLPPMTWYRHEADTGRLMSVNGLTCTRGPQALADLEVWASALELQRKDDATPGVVKFVGEVDGSEVSVWGIVNEEAYLARTHPWHPAGDKVRQLLHDGGNETER